MFGTYLNIFPSPIYSLKNLGQSRMRPCPQLGLLGTCNGHPWELGCSPRRSRVSRQNLLQLL